MNFLNFSLFLHSLKKFSITVFQYFTLSRQPLPSAPCIGLSVCLSSTGRQSTMGLVVCVSLGVIVPDTQHALTPADGSMSSLPHAVTKPELPTLETSRRWRATRQDMWVPRMLRGQQVTGGKV